MLQLPFTSKLNRSTSSISVSDAVSESSDNATLHSLSREDLMALGAGPIREDVRVSRKKLEALILKERDEDTDKHYMELLMERSNTYIQWPSRMKIGAKTKKDLFVRIYGHNPDDVNEAKLQVLADFGPHRDLRITLKMEISYTDHSHLIGCRGGTIRRVMEDTGCHIHFPDSNRMSKEHKSNQVTIAGGSIQAVEQARSRVRELSPLIFQFNLPLMHGSYDMGVNPDAHHIFLETIQSNYSVQITIHPPNKLQQTTVSIKGCECDATRIQEAIGKIINYFAPGTLLSTVTVENTMEISPLQHAFVRAVSDSNVHGIMMSTNAKIIFPDLSDGNIQQIKRSRVYIAGEMNSVYQARQQLLGCLPLRMIFDVADDFQFDLETIRSMACDLNVNVKLINRNRLNSNGPPGTFSALPPPIPGRSRTIQLIAAERNTGNIYEVRRRIFGSIESPSIANIPSTYALRTAFQQSPGGLVQYGNRLDTTSNLPSLMLPTSPNMISPVLSPQFWPPSPFSSLFCSPQLTTCVIPGAQGIGKSTLTPNLRFNSPSGMSDINPLLLSPVEGLCDFTGFDQHRKAPGWERSSTNSALFGSPAATSVNTDNLTTSANAPNDKADRKFMAMKAMYQAKIGNSPRVPTSDWCGYGFSKTSLGLFAREILDGQSEDSSTGHGQTGDTANDNMCEEVPLWQGASASSREVQMVTVSGMGDRNNNKCEIQKGVVSEFPNHKTLSLQQSNLLDLSTSRPTDDANPSTDLPSLFLQNGLEKYIDKFVCEEIDIEAFAHLTESDLRSLGVTSYPARKRMLVMISSLSPLPEMNEYN